MAPVCNAVSIYIDSIDSCVQTNILSSTVFAATIGLIKSCRGGLIQTAADLERLRFCQVINDSLVITANFPGADFTSLFDIQTIDGPFFDSVCLSV